MNLYHEVIHAKYVGQAIVLMRMQSMHGIANTNISKLRFMKATLIPGISIVQHVVYLLIPILGSPIKCAKVQEGDEPCDNVEELYKELDDVLVQLEDLIYRINITNVQIVQDGDSLTRLIAKRDVLSMRVKALKEVVNYVAANDTRFGRNELKYVRTIDIKALRKEADTYAKQYRELDLKIQSLNWTVDLMDLQDLPR